jgi:hypothetical protein
MNRWSRSALILLAAVVLVTPPTFANLLSEAGPGWSGIAGTVGEESYSAFWSFVTRLWAKNGCQVDPSGRCLPLPGHAADNGCSADPNGRCLPLPSHAADNGCSADPSGHCQAVTGSSRKNGCQVDPDGRCLTGSSQGSDNGCSADPDGRCRK